MSGIAPNSGAPEAPEVTNGGTEPQTNTNEGAQVQPPNGGRPPVMLDANLNPVGKLPPQDDETTTQTATERTPPATQQLWRDSPPPITRPTSRWTFWKDRPDGTTRPRQRRDDNVIVSMDDYPATEPAPTSLLAKLGMLAIGLVIALGLAWLAMAFWPKSNDDLETRLKNMTNQDKVAAVFQGKELTKQTLGDMLDGIVQNDKIAAVGIDKDGKPVNLTKEAVGDGLKALGINIATAQKQLDELVHPETGRVTLAENEIKTIKDARALEATALQQDFKTVQDKFDAIDKRFDRLAKSQKTKPAPAITVSKVKVDTPAPTPTPAPIPAPTVQAKQLGPVVEGLNGTPTAPVTTTVATPAPTVPAAYDPYDSANIAAEVRVAKNHPKLTPEEVQATVMAMDPATKAEILRDQAERAEDAKQRLGSQHRRGLLGIGKENKDR